MWEVCREVDQDAGRCFQFLPTLTSLLEPLTLTLIVYSLESLFSTRAVPMTACCNCCDSYVFVDGDSCASACVGVCVSCCVVYFHACCDLYCAGGTRRCWRLSTAHFEEARVEWMWNGGGWLGQGYYCW